MLTAAQLQEKEIYNRMYAEVPEYNTFSPAERLLTHMMSILDKQDIKTILCAGCGRGQAVEMFHEAGYDVKGLDITLSGLLKTANKRLYLEHPIASMPFDDNAFDLVWCVDVLEHIPIDGGELHNSISEIHRVCNNVAIIQVSLCKDGYGKLIGETLHKSVFKPEKWLNIFKAKFDNVVELDRIEGNLILWLKK